LRPANFEAMKRVYASVESQAGGNQSRLQCIESKDFIKVYAVTLAQCRSVSVPSHNLH
jgi:hypothetical protein